ncbi:GspH/FimT family pseudopilin [Vibrio sp. E150_011]|uniref:GspH/FimT family pseudopilin n=1 Tax=Vibrio sp. 10N.261.51.F12 TaxID=3229679 RepID=UPI00354EF978
MVRGFTLLELMISVFVMAVLMIAIVPNFSGLSRETKVERVAQEIYGLMMQTKAHAIMRNEPLWVHFSNLPHGSELGEWDITVTNDASSSTAAVFTLHGQPYKSVYIQLNHNSQQIKFDHLTGVVLSAGTLTISPYSQQESGIKIVTSSASGRIVICQFGSREYGVGRCSS